MDMITRQQARQFILAKQGLIGAYRFSGKDGAYEYVHQAGCIQYDPVDVCGKNAELTLQSRACSMSFFMKTENSLITRIKNCPYGRLKTGRVSRRTENAASDSVRLSKD